MCMSTYVVMMSNNKFYNGKIDNHQVYYIIFIKLLLLLYCSRAEYPGYSLYFRSIRDHILPLPQ